MKSDDPTIPHPSDRKTTKMRSTIHSHWRALAVACAICLAPGTIARSADVVTEQKLGVLTGKAVKQVGPYCWAYAIKLWRQRSARLLTIAGIVENFAHQLWSLDELLHFWR